MEIYTIERKNYPKKVVKMLVGDIPAERMSHKFMDLCLDEEEFVYVLVDEQGNYIERGKNNRWTILSLEDHEVLETTKIKQKKLTEFDLEIYDLWQAPTGNLFLKINHEYSIAIGLFGKHGPSKLEKQASYVKANTVTPVRKVGRLEIDVSELKTHDEMTQIKYI